MADNHQLTDIGAFNGPDRLYKVYRYSPDVYKVIKFHSDHALLPLRLDYESPRKAPSKSYDFKLEASLSRTRRTVLELGLCNDWEYFVTITLNPEIWNRFDDLDKVRLSFGQWVRDLRRRHGFRISYLLIPERHKDGAWHFHGFLSGVPDHELELFKDRALRGIPTPDALRNSDFLFWDRLHKHFGNCSLGRLRCQDAAAFYIVKYVTKDLGRSVSDKCKHMYWASNGLERAHLHSDLVGFIPFLDQYLVNKYEYCSTGFTRSDSSVPWDLVMDDIAEYCEFVTNRPKCFDLFYGLSDNDNSAVYEADSWAQFEQLSLSW